MIRKLNTERFPTEVIDAAKVAEGEDGKENVQLRHSTVVDAEGAYFLSKYFGIGGRFRVRAMSAKSFERFASVEDMAGYAIDVWGAFYDNSGKTDPDAWDNAMWGADGEHGPVTDMNAVVLSDHHWHRTLTKSIPTWLYRNTRRARR